MSDSEADSRLARAMKRLEQAIERVEHALGEGAGINGHGGDVGRLEAALRAAEAEQLALADANRVAAERLEQTIGRLRGLLAP